MIKKIILFTILITFLSAGFAFADYPKGWGIGIQGGFYGGWGGEFGLSRGAAISLKVPSVDIFWAIDLSINNNHFGLGVSGDKYFLHNALVPSIGLDWYIGGGVGVGLGLRDDRNNPISLNAVVRIPIGLSFQPIDLFEIYLQMVPQIGFQFLPGFHFPIGGWPINLGIRLWFK